MMVHHAKKDEHNSVEMSYLWATDNSIPWVAVFVKIVVKVTCNRCFGLAKLKLLGKMRIPKTQLCRECVNKKGNYLYRIKYEIRDEVVVDSLLY